MFLTSKQLRELLGSFRASEDRVECFVILYLQVVDQCNAKIFRVRFATDEELSHLRNRVGYATFFPFIQPENANFDLDLSFHDQRLCLNMLLQLAEKEGFKNIHEPDYIHADGVVDGLPTGVPKGWVKLDGVPRSGTFRCKYMCAPEYRKFKMRTTLAETYACFRMDDVQEERVMWWTGLQEPPADVLELLEFILGNYEHPRVAFDEIDGPGGNGVITLKEFREGLQQMDCKKFAGKDEQSRIEKVFRYLDPGEEGSVSRDEWGILSQLWDEYQLSIEEFVNFLTRTFGDDLRDAWNFLDEDHSGELTFEEYTDALKRIGYFGPARCVFSLLDRSDDGNISYDEFSILKKYQSQGL
jgi:Ca2+-binding EF-hand superfamily protein